MQSDHQPAGSPSQALIGTTNDDSTMPAAPEPQTSHESQEDSTTPVPSAQTRPTLLPVSTDEIARVTMVKGQHDREASVTSSWSTSSDRQLGHSGSVTSNADPTDRVFPIRSVVSVDHSQPGPRALARNPTDFEYNPRPESTWNGRRRPSNPRLATDLTQRSDNVSAPSSSPPPNGPAPRRNRTHTISESIGSPSAIDDRYTPTASLPLFADGASDVSDQTSMRDSRSAMLEGTNSQGGDIKTPGEPNESFMTVRFQHKVTDDGHAVITGRDGTLQRCEDEPIHAPGAVQAFGCLVALREETDGRLSVRIVSENSKKILGFTPQELFRLRSFTDVFSEQQSDNLLDHIDFVRDDDTDPAVNGPDVFSISVRPPKTKQVKLWCALHVNESHPDLIICEFEPEDDHHHPIRPPDELAPEEPEDTLYQNPTAEEFSESTEISSKPLRVLRSARKRRGEAGAMQVFDIMSQVQEQLATAPNLDKFLKILVGIVKELTGFHRVMIYQFDAEFNGKVVTEVVDPAQTRDLYHGLHFPASDIPRQARDLYKLNKVRLLYDRDLESARLVCRTLQDLEQPLDLSHAYLRAMSPIHLKYLANMAVRSSMSISINAFNELWGLIACHSYGSHGMRVPFPIRKMCRLVGDTASRNIERLSYASRLQARKLINTMPTDKNPSGYIIASSEDLLKLFDADFGMLSIRDETKILGKIEHSQEALAMLEYLRLRSFTSVLTTQDISQDFPDLRYPPGFSVIAGLLYVPLSVGGNDFIIFFRKGQIREVKWAGNPYDKIIKEGTANFLEPRSSFKVWHETVIGKCREWTEEQIETAAVLCLVYGKFIEVWRQKEAALQSSRLTRLLLANSAHEVRTPLNAIINYLEIALEGSLDQETRENLARSHSASKSLIYVINDLLDLTKTEEGQTLVKGEIMDLPACILEATEPFKKDAKRKGVLYDVVEHSGLPRYVHGDYRRVRQAVANLAANAMQNTTQGSIQVEAFVTEVLESRVCVEISVHDTGRGMSSEKLDNLFQDLEQVSSADLDESKSDETSLDPAQEHRVLGLGLAVVARMVRNMDGQLRLKSEEGKGSRFVIQLPFDLPDNAALDKTEPGDSSATSPPASTRASVRKTLPPTDAGEVMLVNRGGSNVPNSTSRPLAEKRSFDETNSISSIKTSASNGALSNKSDADRLIDAIQTPLSLGDVDDEVVGIQRKNSRRQQHHINNSTSSLPGALSTAVPPQSPGGSAERPMLRRSSTHPAPVDDDVQPGVRFVQDSKTPIRAIKVPDECTDVPVAPQTGTNSRVLFEIPDKKAPVAKAAKPDTSPPEEPPKLRVLVAEDDPVNLKILKKRLEKSGHVVHHAVNGEDCATVYREKSQEFDIILMDMQMPIVDGLTSTKLIRAFEKTEECPGFSHLASPHGHIPILAVSASLVEKEKIIYTDAGFDGWILKPIDFKRLNVLLDGITDEQVREQCLYRSGEWERGGWFKRTIQVSQPTGSDNIRDRTTDGSSDSDATPTGAEAKHTPV